MKLSVVIACYNEENYIKEVIEHCLDCKAPACIDSREIIVVNDASIDGTKSILEKLKNHPQVQVLHLDINRGKGFCLRKGFDIASGDIVLVQDADLEYDPRENFENLLQPFCHNPEIAVVFGSRFLKSRWPSGMRWPNLLVNYLLALTVNLFYGASISDEATCYKVIYRRHLGAMKLRSERFEFCPEFTSKVLKLGLRMVEVPITYHARTTNQGKKIRFTDAFHAMYVLIRERLSR